MTSTQKERRSLSFVTMWWVFVWIGLLGGLQSSSAFLIHPATRTRNTISTERHLLTRSQQQQRQQKLSFLKDSHNNNKIVDDNHYQTSLWKRSIGLGKRILQRKSNVSNRNETSSKVMKRKRNNIKKFVATLLMVGSTMRIVTPIQSAEAKFSYELKEERSYSIRPGATKEQAESILEGTEVPSDESTGAAVFSDNQVSSTDDDTTESKKVEEKKKKQSKNTYDYGDADDDEDFLFLEDDDVDSKSASSSFTVPSSASPSPSKGASGTASMGTKTSFASSSKGKSTGLTIKVSIGLFIPSFGAMGAREFVRRRKEEVYVKKGLEILEAQKKEFFDVDNDDEASDTEISDELKDLKDQDDDEDDEDDEDDDEDDEDDDEDEDEDDEPPSSRRRPKRPSPGGGGDSGSGGEGGGGGDDRPSEDDLKRLGDLFNKS